MKFLFLLPLTLAVVFAVPVQETTVEERLKSSQGEQLSKQGPVAQEQPEMWEEPIMGEEKQLRPVIGEYESLQRLAEREGLPERRTAVWNDITPQEPMREAGPPAGAGLWEELMWSEELGEELPRTRTSQSRGHTGWPVCAGIIINKICYQFFRGPKRADDAELFCQDSFQNGHLASVTSRYLHQQMMRLMIQDGGAYTRTWIGGLRYLETGRFIWLDGSRWSYADWLSGEPSNTAGVENCVELLSNGKFNDMPCWDLRAFICSSHV
ncbi:macrophage mannose receptor 1 [Anguilla anguilla]|uniref:macrophage mannose receptor 1 n=1 Tax=Anguilla anguilla TaxID=7936 RepID=UPI0015A94058|nr:macrophage mannose receptor 1 [Anguilla anguilla]